MVVTTAFTTGYVGALSASNAAGRLTWATSSDYIGPRNVYMVFGVVGAPIMVSIPYLITSAADCVTD